MEETNKSQSKNRSDAHLQRSVLILGVALVLVVFLSVHLFENSPSVDDVAARNIRTPRNRTQELLQQGQNVYLQLGDHQQAEKLFRRALAMSPRNPKAIDACGQMALIGGNYEQAHSLFLDYHMLVNKTERSYANLAIAQLSLERYEDALATIDNGIKSRHLADSFKFDVIQACIYQKMGKGEEANECLVRAAKGRKSQVLLIAKERKWAAPLKDIRAFQSLIEPEGGKTTEK